MFLQLENIDVDKYEVDLRNCPKPKDGYITKCGTITGEVTAKVKVITGKWSWCNSRKVKLQYTLHLQFFAVRRTLTIGNLTSIYAFNIRSDS